MKSYLKIMLTTALLASSAFSFAQSGNYVMGGAEATNFGIIDLVTPAGKTWSTYRGALPGYFSAVGSANYSSPDDANNVDGYVKHYASAPDQAFNFPVGTGTDYRSLAISGSIPASAVIATAWIVGDPSTTSDPTNTGATGGAHDVNLVNGENISVSKVGQWDWQDFAGNASGVTVTVTIPDLSLFGLASDLRLVGWNGAYWIDLSSVSGSSSATSNTENSTLIGIMQSGISAIGIGAVFKSLPVNLISFEARTEASNVSLSWKVADEKDFGGYGIETSLDGKNFVNIGFVAAANKSVYHYEALMKPNVSNYYRLKLIDLNGSYGYSRKIQTSYSETNPKITMFPNPTLSSVKIEGMEQGVNQIVISNLRGQVLKKFKTEASATELDMSEFTVGSYIIIITNGSKVASEKLIKY